MLGPRVAPVPRRRALGRHRRRAGPGRRRRRTAHARSRRSGGRPLPGRHDQGRNGGPWLASTARRSVQGSANGRTEIVVAEGRSPPRRAASSPGAQRRRGVAQQLARPGRRITDEPYFGALWGLHNTGQSVDGTGGTPDIDIDGLEALRIERGDPNVVVAVIDDGVDFTHPDLAQRMGQPRLKPMD